MAIRGVMNQLAIKTSLNSGDLITLLPGIRELSRKTGQKAIIYQGLNREVQHPGSSSHPIQNEEGFPVTMNEQTFKMLKPLLEAQDYIESFEVYQGQEITFDLDKVREYNCPLLPYAPLHFYPWMFFPEMGGSDLSREWITVPQNVPRFTHIIINRTMRYNNPHINYFFLKDYQQDLLFAGTKEEHEAFCKEWNLYFPYLDVNNFYELACHLKAAKFFLGGQSFVYHLAEAIKTPRILEVCYQFPNTWGFGAGFYPFLYQESLEFQFKKLYYE